jgi:hypothetical protein
MPCRYISEFTLARNLLAAPSVQIRAPSLGTCRNIEGFTLVRNFKLFWISVFVVVVFFGAKTFQKVY